IVGGSPEDRERYQRYLLHDAEHTYTLLEAASAQQGRELYQQAQPDAVLFHNQPQDLNALDFLAQLRSAASPPTCLPIILLIKQENAAVAVQAIKAGAQDYLIKEHMTAEMLHLAINQTIETVHLKTELHQRRERERLVAQVTQHIQRSLDLNTILQIGVDGVRQFLRTNRVLIFRVESDGSGTVVSESVGAPWQSILASNLFDPCFVESYIEPFAQGLVTSKTDIHDGSIDPCHVNLLVQFQVRANLVVPILQDDRLWGLIIAHHCSAPRQWQPLEVDLLKELANQLGIALQQAELYQQSQQELTERKRAVAALQESEDRFRQLAENINTVFWIKEAHADCCSYVSPAYEQLWGLNSQELYHSHQAWTDYIHPEDREVTAKAFKEKAATGQFDQEYRIVLPDGSVRWVRDRCFPLQDETGVLYRFVGIAEDITERKQTEAALRKNEQLLRLALTGARQGIWDWNLKSGVLTWDRQCKEMFGVTPDFPVTFEWHIDALHPDDRQRVQDAAAMALRERTEFHEEYRTLHPDGTMRWILARGCGFYDDAGEPYRMSGTVLDITERKHTEAELQERNAQLQLLYETTRDLLSSTQPLALVETVFHRLKSLIGVDVYLNYILDEPQQQLQLTFYSGIPEDLARQIEWLDLGQAICGTVAQQCRQIVQTDVQHCHDPRCQLVQSLGLTAYACQPLIAQGKLFGTLSFGSRSRTEFTAAEQSLCQAICDQIAIALERSELLTSLQQQTEELVRVNRIKDEFLAVLSHELRSPLNPILGWTKLLQTRNFNPAQTAQALAAIERNAKLQTQLIDDLLDIAKILRGKLSLTVAPVDLVFVIESAIETVSTAAQAKSIQLQTVVPQIGPISGDAVRLQQIVWNLLSNAVKFTPSQGRVEIRLEQVGDLAQITVSDTGKGINPDFLPHIFESFRQEDLSTTRTFGGLGLGLAIVRNLVEAHGGTIWAESPGEGQGAIFTVRLPLLQAVSASNSPEPVPELEPDLAGIRILVVDDERDTRDLINVVLTQTGAEVLAVTTAQEALAALSPFQPHVLVSDIGMPEMNGYALLQQVRALPAHQGGQTPAIALTAYARKEDAEHALRCGFQGHLAKPIEPIQLTRTVCSFTPRDNRG
ncbi:PAS domain-containing protein, partial [Cyanobacteria bacterium FACHB-DQ100]|nr:PAS domain-containing protein [Cyanobacteria bacterium FACHB-DQ100]